MDRRFFLAAGGALCVGAAEPPANPAEDAYFVDWLNGFIARSLAAGWPRALLDRELAGLAPDPRVAIQDARQPEFATPISQYMKGAMTPGRIAEGEARRNDLAGLAATEQTYGVPREILIAIWAMETGFGAVMGDYDVVRCLATLAAAGRRRSWAEAELWAALRILASGEVPRTKLRGSWAGAMGQTQLLPTAYLATRPAGVAGAHRDIWTSPQDALAAAADLLAKAGWRRGEGWAREVVASAGFDLGLAEGPMETPAWWTAKGLRTADGFGWRSADAAAGASFIVPAGAGGPAFLILPNHFVIRSYNNSIAYALAVGLLADRFAGGGPLKTPWPHETPLSLTDRMDAQSALTRLGFDPGPVDGVIGIAGRRALRAWQKSRGLVQDGYLSADLVVKLRAAAALATVPRRG